MPLTLFQAFIYSPLFCTSNIAALVFSLLRNLQSFLSIISFPLLAFLFVFSQNCHSSLLFFLNHWPPINLEQPVVCSTNISPAFLLPCFCACVPFSTEYISFSCCYLCELIIDTQPHCLDLKDTVSCRKLLLIYSISDVLVNLISTDW